MLAIVAVAFVTELGVMFVLGQWLEALWRPQLVLLDAALLAVAIAPPVYFLVLAPLRREGERRLAAERRALDAGRLAMTDPLTGILNRRGIKIVLLEAMAHGDRYHRPLSVAMLDLDGFKQVNDRHGHAVGDAALREVVDVVGQGLREPDRLGRIGGDEFLLVLPETTQMAAQILTARLESLLSDHPLPVSGVRLHLSASIGSVEFRPGEPLQDLLARADSALYLAKKVGPPASNRPRLERSLAR